MILLWSVVVKGDDEILAEFVRVRSKPDVAMR